MPTQSPADIRSYGPGNDVTTLGTFPPHTANT